MRITVSNGIRVKNASNIKRLIEAYQYRDYRKDAIVTSVYYDKTTDEYVFPRNIQKFKQIAGNFTISKDFRVKNKSLENPFILAKNYKLYPFQEEIVKKIENFLEGEEASCILKAPPRTGKSYMLPAIVKHFNKRVLILVDRVSLVEQMFREFKQNTSKGDIQILTPKTNRVADVNISTLQLLNKNQKLVDMLQEAISFVIVDEMHLISVGALTKVFLQFPAYYRLGLSATPTRSDGLTQVLFDHFSYNIVESQNPNNLSAYHILVYYPLTIYYATMYDANRAWKELYLNSKLIDDIVKLAKFLRKEKQRNILIYSTIVEQQNTYKALLEAEGFSVGVINGKTKKDVREKYLEEFKKRSLDFLISGVILQKGITLPNLDTVINTANHTKESFEQMVGRVRGICENKKDPIIFHFGFNGKGAYKIRNTKIWCNNLVKKNNDKFVVWDYDKFKQFLS